MGSHHGTVDTAPYDKDLLCRNYIRYFRSEKTMKDFYSGILGIPVTGATLPVLAFCLMAIYGKNILLGVAVIILGIGHIGIHLMHKKEIET